MQFKSASLFRGPLKHLSGIWTKPLLLPTLILNPLTNCRNGISLYPDNTKADFYSKRKQNFYPRPHPVIRILKKTAIKGVTGYVW